MFEEKIAAMNQRTEESLAASAGQFEKRTYTVDEIQDILGVSRTSAYNLVKKKVFHSVRIGGSIRISKKSFDDWLDQQCCDLSRMSCYPATNFKINQEFVKM